MSSVPSTLERFKQPEYTGENRCMPCTVTNSIIAVVLAAVVGILTPPLVGVFALVTFGATIYLRGYLVPGTPELTQRYFPEWLLRAFGKEPIDLEEVAAAEAAGADGSTTTRSDSATDDRAVIEPEDTEAMLTDAGVVEECADDDDLCLTDAFGSEWWATIRTFRDDREAAIDQLASVIDVDPADLDFEAGGSNYVVTYEGDRIATWTSDAAFYADLAAEPTLGTYLSEWDRLPDRTRTELLASMRAFLESCPACEADLEQVENVRKSCCSSDVVGVSVDCGECGARVFSGSYR